jgi:hypothetical protein
MIPVQKTAVCAETAGGAYPEEILHPPLFSKHLSGSAYVGLIRIYQIHSYHRFNSIYHLSHTLLPALKPYSPPSKNLEKKKNIM